jgi:SAM-dependent methyltransferase
MLKEIDFQIAPCLSAGPLAEKGQELIAAARALGASRWASLMRAWCVPYVYENMERAFASGEEPAQAVNQALDDLTRFLRAASASGFPGLYPADAGADGAQSLGVKEVTGEHYGRLFEKFSQTSFWGETVRLLRTRLERNGIPLSELAGKHVLDAGCGGGRYTVAWRLLGAERATGLDISPVNVADARRRVEPSGEGGGQGDGVEFEQGDVLNLPYADATFDIVFSNGVLHHTEDWRRGVEELVRVLKPGGMGWLYLIENPGGLFWDLVEIMRVLTQGERREVARAALEVLGIPGNRIFYMLDHVMVPINVRLTPDEVESCLAGAGAVRVRRLTRGTDFDRIEQIYREEPYAAMKFGVGENRYVFSKD